MGNLVARTDPLGNIGRFDYDPMNRLARTIDAGGAEAGRFLGADTIGFAGADANLYRYVGNSPSNFIDPRGTEQTSFSDTVNATSEPALRFLNPIFGSTVSNLNAASESILSHPIDSAYGILQGLVRIGEVVTDAVVRSALAGYSSTGLPLSSQAHDAAIRLQKKYQPYGHALLETLNKIETLLRQGRVDEAGSLTGQLVGPILAAATIGRLGTEALGPLIATVVKNPAFRAEIRSILEDERGSFSNGNAPKGVQGQWRNVNESMSPRAATYQQQITGGTGQSYFVNGVKFDGTTGSVLLDAKGPGYANFVRNDQFLPWYRGADELVDQALRQLQAAGGTPIRWHVAEADAAMAIRNLFADQGITGIDIVYTPVVVVP